LTTAAGVERGAGGFVSPSHSCAAATAASAIVAPNVAASSQRERGRTVSRGGGAAAGVEVVSAGKVWPSGVSRSAAAISAAVP
jgi:hypothetical protein